MIENQIKNLLCLRGLIDENKLDDDYVYELMDRYIGFRPSDPTNFLICIRGPLTFEMLIKLFESHYGDFSKIKRTPPVHTHPNFLDHIEECIKIIPKEELRELKLKELVNS
jgi:hypothetical protein